MRRVHAKTSVPQRGEFKQVRLKLVEALLRGERFCLSEFARRMEVDCAVVCRVIKALGDAVYREKGERNRIYIQAKDIDALELELLKHHFDKPSKAVEQRIIWRH